MTAPAFTVASRKSYGAVTTGTDSITPTGTNTCAYVWFTNTVANANQINTGGGAPTIGSVTGVRVGGGIRAGGNPIAVELWRFLGVATGSSQTLTWGATGSTGNWWTEIVCYSGVNQSTPDANFATAAAAGGSPDTAGGGTVTSATGDLVIDYISSASDPNTDGATAAGGQTQRFGSTSAPIPAGSEKAGASSVTMAWTRAVTDVWLWAGVSVKALGSGATAVTITGGPTSGAVNAASTNFTFSVDSTPITGTLTVAPTSNKAGVWSPTTVSLTTGSPSATATFTPSVSGVHTIGATNDGSLSNPTTQSYTVKPAVTIALVTLPSGGSARGNETSLKWSWWDTANIGSVGAPVNQGTAAAIAGGAGSLTIALPNSTLVNGQTGLLAISNSDGTTTQSPAPWSFLAPCLVT